MKFIILMLIYFIALTVVESHVRLTFPKAREYDLDFLVSTKIRQPCGMPENATGTIFKTKLITGSTFNVTWHLAFPHPGGFRIQILSRSGGYVLHELTPTNDTVPWYSVDDPVIPYYTATLPTNFTCAHCILRIIHDDSAQSTPERPYNFRSCADVDIYYDTCTKLNCYNLGSVNGNCTDPSINTCNCPYRTSGDRCEYMNECEKDTDCSNDGKCLSINQDYNYPIKQCYCPPGYYGVQCKTTSVLTEAMLSDVTTYNYQKLDSNSEIWFKILSASQELEVIHKTTTKNWVGLGWRPQGLLQSCELFPSGAAPGLLIGPPPSAEPEGTAEGTSSSSPEQGSSEPGGSTVNSMTPVKHKMDCTDMVIGSARGNLSRLFDYYTRDRSTPKMDAYYGGKDSLTAAVGMENDGTTIIRWRKKLNSGEATDHAITDAIMQVIYAYGQGSTYHHKLQSGLVNTSREKTFYGADELKYHGSLNRGQISLNFYGQEKLTVSTCSGSWGNDCTGNVCNYKLTWNIMKNGTVNFMMNAKTDKWVALGISNDMKMTETDAIVMHYANNEPVLLDDYIAASYVPTEDATNNVNLINGSSANGFVTFHFSRPVNTSDTKEDISLHGCHHFFFGIGGSFTNKRPGKHSNTPFRSKLICIESYLCATGGTAGIFNFTHLIFIIVTTAFTLLNFS